VRIDSESFAKGVAYQISKDSIYGELWYSVKAVLTLNRLGMMVPPSNFLGAVAAENFEPRFATFLPNPPGVGNRASQVFTNLLEPSVFAPAVSGGVVYSSNVSAQVASYPPDVQKELRLDVSISVRIESEILVSWQVDEVKLAEPGE
jgi:hypothetical protein